MTDRKRPGLYKAEGGEVLVHEYGKPARYEKTDEPFFIRIVEDEVKPGSKESLLRAAAVIRVHNDREEKEELAEAELERRTERVIGEVMAWAHVFGNMEAFVNGKEKIKADIKRILKEEFDAHDSKTE